MPETYRSVPKTTLLCLAAIFLFGCSQREARIQEKLTKAQQLIESNQLHLAQKLVEDALTLDPQNLSAAQALSHIAFTQGRLRFSYQALQFVKTLAPDDLQNRARLATILTRAGMLPEAKQEALYVLQKDPSLLNALILLAEATPGSNEAVQDTINLIQDLPLDESPIPERDAAFAILFSKLPQYQTRAKTFFERAHSSQSENPLIHLKYAQFLWRSNQPEVAAHAFQTALKLSISSPDPTTALEYAHFLKRQDNTQAAIETLQTALEKAPEHLPCLSELAEIRIDNKQFDQALSLVEKSLLVEPDYLKTKLLKARILRARNKPEASIAILEELAKDFPRSSKVQFELGLSLLANSKTTNAISALKRARHLGSDPTEINILLASANIVQEDFSEAVFEIRDYLKRQPDDLQAQLFLAETLSQNDSYEQAIELYSKIQSKLPLSPEIPFKIGKLYLQQKQFTSAQHCFEEAYSLSNNSHIPSLRQLVVLALVKQQPQRAQSLVDSHLQTNQANAETHTLYAIIAVSLPDYANAQEHLRQAIQLDPKNEEAYRLSANAYLSANDPEQAVQRLQELLEFSPQNIDSRLMLGSLFVELRDDRAAQQEFQHILKNHPKNAFALNNLAYIYSKEKDTLAEAFSLASQARQIDYTAPIIADTLGWIVYKQKNYEWALPLLEEAVHKLPTHPEINYHYAKTLYAMGDTENAADAFNEALKLSDSFPQASDAQQRSSILKLDYKTLTPKDLKRLDSLLESDTTDPIASRLKAQHAVSKGNYQTAIDLTKNALKSYPKNGYLKTTLATALMLNGSQEQAFSYAKEAYESIPDNPETLATTGKLAYLNKDHRWSRTLLSRAYQHSPTDPELQIWFLLSTLANGDLETSKSICNQIITTLPKHPLATTILKFLSSATEDSLTIASQIAPKSPAYLASQIHIAQHQITKETQDSLQSAIETYTKILSDYPFCSIALTQLTQARAQLKYLQETTEKQSIPETRALPSAD